MRQAAVEEHVGRGENRRAVHVVLHLLGGLVAEAHRAHAAIAGERGDRPLLRHRAAADAVHRLQPALGRAGDDVDDVAQVALHRARRAEAVQGVDDEIGVAQPAVAVIPGPARARRLGDRGRHRGDHRARVFERIELQRDGRADDGLLPFEGDAEVAHPFAPVADRLFDEAPPHVRDRALHRLVRAEQQRDRVFEEERGLLADRRDGGVGGEPQHEVGADVADVVAAAGGGHRLGAAVVGGAQPHAHARVAGDAPDLPHQGHGAEHAPVLTEPRGAVGDLDGAAQLVVQPRHQDRRVGEVFLLVARGVDQVHAEEAEVRLGGARCSSEQNAGSPSNRGKQVQTISPAGSTRAPIVPFPTRARSSEVMEWCRGPRSAGAPGATAGGCGAACPRRRSACAPPSETR